MLHSIFCPRCSSLLSFLCIFCFLSSLGSAHVLRDTELEDSFHMLFMSGSIDDINDTVWEKSIAEIIKHERGTNGSDPESEGTARISTLLWLGSPQDVGPHPLDHSITVGKGADFPFSASAFQEFLRQYVNRWNSDSGISGSNANLLHNIVDTVPSSGVNRSKGILQKGSSLVPEDGTIPPSRRQPQPQRPASTNASSLSVSRKQYYFQVFPASSSSALSSYFVNSVCLIYLDVFSARPPSPDLEKTIFRRRSSSPLRYASSSTRVNRKEETVVGEDNLLGEQQWKWLEAILSSYLSPTMDSREHSNSTHTGHARGSRLGNKERAGEEQEEEVENREYCAVTVIASRWQILLNDNKPLYGWDWYPASRSRLLHLLQKHKVSRFIFLSGHTRGIAEIGSVERALSANVLPENRVLRLYASSAPVTPPTNLSAELLPLHTPLVEVSSSFSSLDKLKSRVPSLFRSAVNYFYHRGIRPTFKEDEKPTNFLPRYLSLSRETLHSPSIGTFQVKQTTPTPSSKWDKMTISEKKSIILASFNVTVILHSISRDPERKEGALRRKGVREQYHPLHSDDDFIIYTSSLAFLPSFNYKTVKEATMGGYTVAETSTSDSYSFPQFVVYNTLREYPILKRVVIALNCPEFECLETFSLKWGHQKILLSLFVVVIFSCVLLRSKQCFLKFFE